MEDTGPPRVDVVGVAGMPEVRPGDRLAEMIARAADAQGTPIAARDVVVVTQKVVSKAEGRLARLSDVTPSAFATAFAARSGRDARLVELVLGESRTVVRADAARGILIVETEHGFVCANAGIDSSNVEGEGVVSLLPKDPDASARGVLEGLLRESGLSELAVVISDTFGRAWREGHSNLAIGVAGMEPLVDYRGTRDAHGSILSVTRVAVADETAAAAELVMGKSLEVPVALVRGVAYSAGPGGYASLIRDRSQDLFR